MPTQPPQRIGDYEVLSVLGAGGMGRVYKVRNVITDRVEAMKVLLPDLQGHEEVAARFLREIKVLAALKHPHIAGLHTAQTIDNQLVMIMEYVEGMSLASRLNMGPLPAPDALNYLDQVLSALAFAHQRRVIHRDIKPANMMLTTENTIKLMDFGIARTEGEPNQLTAPGSTLGSMSYMSPEQIKGETTDERSDLYSLGVSLYEMVTGAKPFEGDSSFSIMAAHINQTPKPPLELNPSLPSAVNDLILTAIAKAPEQRFQSADAFRFAVQRVSKSMQDEKTFIQGSDKTITGGGFAATPATSPTAAFMAARGNTPVPTAKPTAPPPIPAAAQTMPHMPPPAPIQQGNSRVLYMVLGAVILMVVIAGAAMYLPKSKQVSADAKPAETAQPAATAAPTTQPAAAQQSTAAAPAEPTTEPAASGTSSASAAAPATKSTFAPPRPVAAAPAAAVPSAQAAADAAELDEIERDIDLLSSRVASVNNGLDNLQRQQAAMGYGLRGDMAARQASMKNNFAKAQNAIAANDGARAKRYAEAAAKDVEVLERFLGR